MAFRCAALPLVLLTSHLPVARATAALASSEAAFCDGSRDHVCADDDLALLQRSSDSRRSRSVADERWPDLGKLKGLADGVKSTAAAGLVEQAVNKVVKEVNATMDEVDRAVDRFGARAVKLQHRFELDANATMEENLSVVVSLVNKTMATAAADWGNVSDMLQAASDLVVEGLDALNQKELAEQFNATLERTVSRARAVVASALEAATKASNLASQRAAQGLRELNTTLAMTVTHVGAFVLEYEGAFAKFAADVAAEVDAKLPAAAAKQVDVALQGVVGRANESAQNILRIDEMVTNGLFQTIDSVSEKYDEVTENFGPLAKIKEILGKIFR